MDVRVGDILLMKKKHPCGGEEFTVTRSGMDFKLVCRTCGRESDHSPVPRPNAISKKSPTRRSSSGALCH